MDNAHELQEKIRGTSSSEKSPFEATSCVNTSYVGSHIVDLGVLSRVSRLGFTLS